MDIHLYVHGYTLVYNDIVIDSMYDMYQRPGYTKFEHKRVHVNQASLEMYMAISCLA